MSVVESAFSGFPTVENPIVGAINSIEAELELARNLTAESIDEAIRLIVQQAQTARNAVRDYSRIRGNNNNVDRQTQRVLSVIRFDQFPTSFQGFIYV